MSGPSVRGAQVLWDMLDGPMPRGVLGLSDPDVHHVDGRWVMFLGGFSTSFRNRLYRATLPAGDGLRARRRYRPIGHGWIVRTEEDRGVGRRSGS